MRLKDVNLSCNNELNINIMELPTNCVILISDGKVKLGELPPFAETQIVTHAGKVRRIKWNEGEEF